MAINRSDLDAGLIDLSDVVDPNGAPIGPIHPGEILKEEFLIPLGMSVYALAANLQLPRTRLNDIVLGRRSITADTALRLARYFGTTPQFWINLQSSYDLLKAEAENGDLIADQVRPRAA